MKPTLIVCKPLQVPQLLRLQLPFTSKTAEIEKGKIRLCFDKQPIVPYQMCHLGLPGYFKDRKISTITTLVALKSVSV